MQSWMLRHISDYWDQRVDAIDRLSRAFAALPKGEKETAFNAIYNSVTLHADKLSTEEMCKFAVAMVDDLYKAANQMSQFDQDHLQYLKAGATAFFNSVARRGYMIHYFTNNTFSDLRRPVFGFPIWFKAASISYVCPQEIAVRGSENPGEWQRLIGRDIAASRSVANRTANELRDKGRSFVFLDIDAADFAAAEQSLGKPGVIWVFREDAPVAGTRVKMAFPSEPQGATAPKSG